MDTSPFFETSYALAVEIPLELNRTSPNPGSKQSAVLDPGWRLGLSWSWNQIYTGYGYRYVPYFSFQLETLEWSPPANSYIVVPDLSELPFTHGQNKASPTLTAFPGRRTQHTIYAWSEIDDGSPPEDVLCSRLRLTLTVHIPGHFASTTSTSASRVFHHLISSDDGPDTKFNVFSARRADGGACAPRSLFGVRSLLLGKSDELDDLLRAEGFSQTDDIPSYADSDTYNYDADSDLEDEDSTDEADIISPETLPESSAPLSTEHIHPNGSSYQSKTRSIVIKDGAFVTWKSLLFYLYSDRIHFAPLKSSGIQKRKEFIRKHLEQNPGCPTPCSPKSMLRLADKYGLTVIRDLALKAINSDISEKNVVQEYFSPVSIRYHDVSQILRVHLQTHKAAVKDAFQARLAKSLELGEPLESIVEFLAASVDALMYP